MLTPSNIPRLKPRATRYDVPDTKLVGLFLTVLPSDVRTWSLRYSFQGRRRRLVLGRYPALGLEKARSAAGKALQAVAMGTDPQAEKVETRRKVQAGVDSEELFGAIFERYKTLHIATLRASTASRLNNVFNHWILPKWRKRRLSEVTKRDVIALLDEIVAAGSPVAANHVLAVANHFFGWCVGRDIIATSPTAGVKKPSKQASRTRVLGDAELSQAWRAAERIGWPFKQVVHLLILTGQRREEVAGMTERELFLPDHKWKLPAERSKNHRPHTIHLAKLSQSILEDSPRVKNKAAFVFSTNGETAVSGFSRAKERLDEEMLEIAKADAEERFDNPKDVAIEPFTIHDLRRSFASGLARLGVRLEVIERCLNHVSGSFGGIVGVYQQHDFAKECAEAWELWAKHIAKTIKPS